MPCARTSSSTPHSAPSERRPPRRRPCRPRGPGGRVQGARSRSEARAGGPDRTPAATGSATAETGRRGVVPPSGEHLGGHQRSVLGKKEGDLPLLHRRDLEDLDSLRQHRRVYHATQPRAPRRVCPHGRVVARHDRLGASRVPRGGQHHDHRPADALDITVEGAPEALLVLGRHERVDEDDRVRSLVVHATDLLLPAVALGRPGRMKAGPPPETGSDLLHAHARRALASPSSLRPSSASTPPTPGSSRAARVRPSSRRSSPNGCAKPGSRSASTRRRPADPM